MKNLLFALIFIPLFYLLAYFIFSVCADVNLYLKLYMGMGLVLATGLFFLKRAGRTRSAWPINGTLDQNYDRYYRGFSDAGYEIEEVEPLDGRQLRVPLNLSK